MRRAIAALEKVGQIHQITNGCWLFKALLAPKPHQEHIQNINDFIWHFYINYIQLNSVTRIIAYPIPRCDLATNEEFGLGVLYWLFNAPMGYHQLAVTLASQEKLTFQGPDAIKWMYRVMPFGPTNGPATFINFIHYVDSLWKALAEKSGLVINDDTNTKIIVNNIFSWAKTINDALLYIVKEYAQAEGVLAELGVASELAVDLSRGNGVPEAAVYCERVPRTSARPHVDLVLSENGTGTCLTRSDT